MSSPAKTLGSEALQPLDCPSQTWRAQPFKPGNKDPAKGIKTPGSLGLLCCVSRILSYTWPHLNKNVTPRPMNRKPLPDLQTAAEDHINMRILPNMVSGTPPYVGPFGLGIRM